MENQKQPGELVKFPEVQALAAVLIVQLDEVAPRAVGAVALDGLINHLQAGEGLAFPDNNGYRDHFARLLRRQTQISNGKLGLAPLVLDITK